MLSENQARRPCGRRILRRWPVELRIHGDDYPQTKIVRDNLAAAYQQPQ